MLLLAAAATQVELADETFNVPAAEWRYIELDLKQQPVTVVCRYSTLAPSREVRVALLRREDLDRMREERPHGVLATVPRAAHGLLRHTVTSPGEYAVVIDNRAAKGEARVHLRVALDFAHPNQPAVRYVSPVRRMTVIALSVAFFFAVVLYSGRKLLRGARHR
ncbi:MAG: hypothetical protein ACE15B_04790 [Bryobacteraceae bacterium]